MTTSELMAPSATVVRRRSRRRRRRTNAVERLDLIGVIACAAGAAVLANSASATAYRAVDLILSAALAGLVTLDAVAHAIRDKFSGKVAENNVAAASEAYQVVRREMEEAAHAQAN